MSALYPEASRFIPATPTLLAGWCGPVLVRWSGHTQIEDETSAAHDDEIVYRNGDLIHVSDVPPSDDADTIPATRVFLDPLRGEVRDHLVRALALPSWLRDTPGTLDPWISAGLIACSAAGIVPLNGHGKSVRRVPRGSTAGKKNHDNLLAGYALRLDANTVALPWPGGPRLWKRP